jgi:predicted small metal-binding protein
MAKSENSPPQGRNAAKQITCECGFVARAENEDEVIGKIRAHMRSDHPDLLEKVSDKDLRGWIEEV